MRALRNEQRNVRSGQRITVGQGSGYDYDDLAHAWNSITDSGPTKPYLIDVDHGEWEFTEDDSVRRGVDGRAAWQLGSKTDITIQGRGLGSKFIRRSDTAGSYGGGTISIGDDLTTVTTQRIAVLDLHIINENNGGTEGSPPEGALYIGQEDTFSAAGVLPWTDVVVAGCQIEGIHDALQAFGPDANYANTTVGGSRLVTQGNRILSVHDAYTIKGAVMAYSIGDYIYVNTNGFAPHMNASVGGIEAWKCTGYHMNCGLAQGAGDERQFNNTMMSVVGGRIVMEGGLNVGGGAQQRVFAACLQYQGGHAYPMRVVGTHITMDIDEDASSGVYSAFAIKAAVDAPDGWIDINGNVIEFTQRNSGSSAPDTISAFYNAGSHASGSIMRCTNNTIYLSQAKTNAYVYQTAHANATIKKAGNHSVGHTAVSTSHRRVSASQSARWSRWPRSSSACPPASSTSVLRPARYSARCCRIPRRSGTWMMSFTSGATRWRTRSTTGFVAPTRRRWRSESRAGSRL
jgi:hypothetical protein